MISRLTHLLLFLAAALVLSAVHAAEAPPPTEPAETTVDTTPSSDSDTKNDSNRTLSGAEARRANDKGGVFRPSEDISEDLAVSFPVDI